MPRVAQRDRRRGASDEVVCVLADAFGFESADDYGRANEATLPRLCAQARRARALAKVSAFVSRHGLAFSPPSSPPTISEQQVQVDYGRANEATLSRLRAQAYRLDNGLAAMKASLKDKRSALAALDSEIGELERTRVHVRPPRSGKCTKLTSYVKPPITRAHASGPGFVVLGVALTNGHALFFVRGRPKKTL